jgi:nitrogen fixation protein FixH
VSILIQDRSGNPPQIADLRALIGRKTESSDDFIPEFSYKNGFYLAPATLDPGAWLMHLDVTAPDGTKFKQRINFFVKG